MSFDPSDVRGPAYIQIKTQDGSLWRGMPEDIWWGRTSDHPEWQYLLKLRFAGSRERVDIPVCLIVTWKTEESHVQLGG